jgi:16S rRNA (uracil1498-N3)-methyltransferase
VVVFDGEGGEWDASLAGDGTSVELAGKRADVKPGGARITVLAAVLKHGNFDIVVRKSAELGAVSLVPIITARTVKKAPGGVERWRRISSEASRQCRRADLMAVSDVTPFGRALSGVSADLKLMALEGTAGGFNAHVAPQSIAILTGPEGGWTRDEAAAASAAGFTAVGLGPRILRGETAPLVMLSILQYLFGDTGPKRMEVGKK